MSSISHAIKWENNMKEKDLLSTKMQQTFQKYFLGEYVRDSYLTDELIHINGFLKTLSKQELDIFLLLKGNFGRPYIDGKVFIEILLYCVDETGPVAKRPILCAINYIISKHLPSKEIVIQNIRIIEKIANCDNSNINGIARSIIQSVGHFDSPPIKPQYIFKKDEQYAFYTQFREIIKRAKNTIKFWDNYADHMFFDYILNYVDINTINEIQVLFQNKQYENDLRMAYQFFCKQYSNIKIDIKKSSTSHDRFIIINNERWQLGPSLKDGGNKVCSIVQLKDSAGDQLENIFDDEWNKSISII